jgi:hypothetical protein
MPLSPLQSRVAGLLRTNRTARSHLAGGALVNRSAESLRFTEDLDYFQDTGELVESAAKADAETLVRNGISVEWLKSGSTHWRAAATDGTESFRIEWAQDSPFRFFPILEDAEFGYVLHPADAATNKVLALVGRTEIRDYIDILELHRTYLSFGAMIWAACAKDPGYSPQMILDMTNRHSRFQPEELAGQRLTRSTTLQELKQAWISAREQAASLFEKLPEAHLGCLYLDERRKPVTPNPDDPSFEKLTLHFGKLFGSWPTSSQ